MNGECWFGKMLPTGEDAMVRVEPPKVVLEAQSDEESSIASAIFNQLDATQLAIPKRVHFNPTAFAYYS